MQKAVFYTLKGHLLHCKRWPFRKLLTINGLHGSHKRGYKLSFTPLPGKCIPAVTSLFLRM